MSTIVRGAPAGGAVYGLPRARMSGRHPYWFDVDPQSGDGLWLSEERARMELREEEVSGVTTLALKGHIDSTTAPVLGQRLDAAVAVPRSRLIVDFREIDYISSAGFRVLLVAAKRADATGSRLVLCGLSGRIHQLFDLGGFLDVFTIAASRDDAIASAK